jgi:hypothetical protein
MVDLTEVIESAETAETWLLETTRTGTERSLRHSHGNSHNKSENKCYLFNNEGF